MKPGRASMALSVMGACLFGLCLCSLVLGSAAISVQEILGILGRAVGLPVDVTWPAWKHKVVWDLRMPRIVVGAAVGSALALSGVALQALFQNPLASPSVLGVSSGAALGAATTIFLGWAAASVFLLPAMACSGAVVTALLVYFIAARRGRVPVGTLLLAGVAVASFNAALTSFVISMSLKDFQIGREVVFWLLGGLDARTWQHVKIVGPVLCLGGAVILAYARDLDALVMGEIHAASVGVDVHRVRRVIIVVTSLLTGAAVAVSGTIGFVGLVVPHMLRLLLGPGHRWLLPASLLGGAIFVVGADILARLLIAPEEMRLGVITAMVGAPFFVALLLRRRRGMGFS